MKWIYSTKGDMECNPICIDMGEIEKIVHVQTPGSYPADIDIYTEGVRFCVNVKMTFGRKEGCVLILPMNYLNPPRKITTVIDMNGRYPKDGDEVDMRGVRRWKNLEPACSDPRVMYVFNVLADAFRAMARLDINKQQYRAICEAVCANIPDRKTAIAYHKRFGYPLGKGALSENSKKREKLCDDLMENPLSEEKVEFLLSLIK